MSWGRVERRDKSYRSIAEQCQSRPGGGANCRGFLAAIAGLGILESALFAASERM